MICEDFLWVPTLKVPEDPFYATGKSAPAVLSTAQCGTPQPERPSATFSSFLRARALHFGPIRIGDLAGR